MTDAQATARRMLKKNQQYLSTQQIKTLNGLIKSGDITGAMNGLHIERFSGVDENESD